ncbi:hypothetical protein AUR64_13645 [Haloprofundus marisrubri]|uniref:Uncharacterized protein n=1 Tax=Haloprofundus marisrubri TaxID=1514971 RepID=A0A0W1R7M7_9EURY|nr:hypothetical protein [Haloprofundus marisrubri]KTG08853.1 hypothetical protein AUR64_13645 [Haloprofundus marisrubri]
MTEAHETVASVTRRQLVRAAASGSGTTAVGPAFVVAPNDRQTDTTTVTAEAILPESTDHKRDHVGRLVHVVGRLTEDSATDVVDDETRPDGRRLQQYEAVFVEPATTDAASRTSCADLQVLSTTPLQVGSLFVVERTRRESDRIHVTLEPVSTSRTEPEQSTGEHGATVSATVDRCRGVTAAGVETLSTLASVFAVVYAFGRRVGSR